MTKLLIGIVRFYQYLISPIIGSHCRYDPSCSAYMIDALKKKGFWHGGILGVKRLLRCHPWGGHGYDPVSDDEKGLKNDK